MMWSPSVPELNHTRLRPHFRALLLGLAGVGTAIFAATAAFYLRVNLSTAGSIELLLVVLVALRWGFAQATLVSVTAALCLNFLFTLPLFRLSVADPENLVSLATFEATALLVSRLSSKVRQHAAEVELERKRNAKLYELSRAVLMIDVRRSTSEQVAELIRDLIEVEVVDIWSVYEFGDTGPTPRLRADSDSAHGVYLTGRDSDDVAGQRTGRLLRVGTSVIGAIMLQRWQSDPPLADAVASLVAIALERARAIRKENRAEAERNTEQLRTAVLDGLAHSYKTPLTAIQTASSGLLAICDMTPTQTELVSIIDDQATVLSRLTARLLQTAALESKEVRLRRSKIDIQSLVRDVVEAQEEPIQTLMQLSFADYLKPISVDTELMKLALAQLVDNATKYSEVGPNIHISVVQNDDETVISVTNAGPAIAPAERERIFLRFQRGFDAARGPTGTGLGLSIVKKTAEAHGGRAWVESANNANSFFLAVPNYAGGNDE